MQWTEEAKASLKRVPFFVRPLVRRRAEGRARELGKSEVDGELMRELRAKEHTGPQ
jgi:hypothetical protein